MHVENHQYVSGGSFCNVTPLKVPNTLLNIVLPVHVSLRVYHHEPVQNITIAIENIKSDICISCIAFKTTNVFLTHKLNSVNCIQFSKSSWELWQLINLSHQLASTVRQTIERENKGGENHLIMWLTIITIINSASALNIRHFNDQLVKSLTAK